MESKKSPATAATGHERPAIENPATLEALLQLTEKSGQDELGSVIESLRTQGNSCVSVIRDALESGDTEGVVKVSHGLIGSAGALGATILESICRRICTGARQGELQTAAELLEPLQHELERTLVALTKLHRRDDEL